MISTLKSQRGMTAIGMMSILVLVGFVLMLVGKSFPSYLDQFKVSSALNGLITDSRAKGASDKELMSLVIKKLQVDDVESIGLDNIVITKTTTGINIQIKYESRVSMFSNVDAVIMFDESIELPR